MARNYRQVARAEEKLLTAKAILDGLDTATPSSAWFACGYLKGLVADAIALLAQGPTKAGLEAYVAGQETIDDYLGRTAEKES